MQTTNLDKIFWKEEGYTKGDVIAYYESVAKVILPHLKDRPMVLNRHPNGITGESFFQKNVNTAQIPSWVHTVPVKHHEKTVRYILVQDKDTLIYVANLGCIELNPFHSHTPTLEKPDYLLIDLDPENVPFDKVVSTALIIHEIFEDLKVPNYCKTSGGRGLHIYVPLGAQYEYEQVQYMTKLIAFLALQKLPDLISLERSPSKRQKQIYIDVPRNSWGQTIAAPYSLRPRPGAPASTPLEWEEVKAGLDPLAFNMKTVPKRVAKVGDLFKPVLKKGVNWKHILDRLQENIR
jgi:bifunctional non-homologous end joining protein LigD